MGSSRTGNACPDTVHKESTKGHGKHAHFTEGRDVSTMVLLCRSLLRLARNVTSLLSAKRDAGVSSRDQDQASKMRRAVACSSSETLYSVIVRASKADENGDIPAIEGVVQGRSPICAHQACSQ